MKLAKLSFNVLMFQCEAFWILFLNFFILNSLVQAASDSVKTNDCPKSVDHCAKNMKSVLNDTRFTFPRNDHQLDILCLHLNRTITCINKFIECDLTSNVKDTFNGLLQLMEKLCSKSSKFRIEYLKHAECYHRLAPVYTKCYQLYYESEKQRIELNRNITTSQHLILWCCNYKNHRKCTTDPVSRYCGSDAANLAEQIVIISEGQDTLDHCPKHIVTSSICLKQWESLGLLVNTTYTSNGNIEFLSDEENLLYPDRISSSASGSLSPVTRNCNNHLNTLTLVNPFLPSILQSIALVLIMLVYNHFNVFTTFPVKCCSQEPTLISSKLTPFSNSRATSSHGALKDPILRRLSLVKEKT